MSTTAQSPTASEWVSFSEQETFDSGVRFGERLSGGQVILLNGVIHLLYTQGKMESQQRSPGLTKFGQSSWSIYYQQRPFPN